MKICAANRVERRFHVQWLVDDSTSYVWESDMSRELIQKFDAGEHENLWQDVDLQEMSENLHKAEKYASKSFKCETLKNKGEEDVHFKKFRTVGI